MQGLLGVLVNKDVIIRLVAGATGLAVTVADDNTPNISKQDSQYNANNNALITDNTWYPLGLAGNALALTNGLRYELWARSSIISDILDLTWVSLPAPAAIGASVIGRGLYLNQPIIIVPDTPYLYLYVRAIGNPAALGGGGFNLYLTPCSNP